MERLARAARSMSAWTEKQLSALENRTLIRGVLFVLLFACMAGIMYLLNANMPLILDDYDFMYSWATGKLLAGFSDVIRSQLVHYMTWGGRMLHVFTQSFLYLGKPVFNAANTAVFMLLLLEIYAIARPARRFCWPILLIAYLCLMTMLPFFGTVFLWLTGACIYLWGTFFALLPLVIIRSVKEEGFFSRGKMRGILCLFMGILAGWTNENTTCGMIAAVFVFLLGDYLKKKRIAPRLILLFAGQCIGAMLLLLAPGNYARASVYEYDSMLAELLKRFVLSTGYGMCYLGLLLGALLLMLAGMREKAVRAPYAGMLVFASLVSVYAMVGSPELSDRTFTGPFVLMLAALLVLVGDADMYARKLDAAKIAALPLALVFMVYTGYHAMKDVRQYAADWNARADAIAAACEREEKQVVIDPVKANSRFAMDIVLEQDASKWPNSTISKYYGIDVIGR